MHPDVRIYLVWPRTEPDQSHIGFGAHRWLFMAFIVVCLVPAAAFTLLLLLDADRSLLAGISGGGLFLEVVLLAANLRHYRFYEIDSAARPLRALSVQPPRPVSGRRPITRRRFLSVQGH